MVCAPRPQPNPLSGGPRRDGVPRDQAVSNKTNVDNDIVMITLIFILMITKRERERAKERERERERDTHTH